jgi:asparagine N-glycosylation enzyme membrane subunit Stt3
MAHTLLKSRSEGKEMLWTIAVILAVMWLLGIVSSYTLGGFLHILLVLAVAAVLINIIQGRRPI